MTTRERVDADSGAHFGISYAHCVSILPFALVGTAAGLLLYRDALV